MLRKSARGVLLLGAVFVFGCREPGLEVHTSALTDDEVALLGAVVACRDDADRCTVLTSFRRTFLRIGREIIEGEGARQGGRRGNGRCG